jgi:drug/metabolite transporter (DMT)-like permease
MEPDLSVLRAVAGAADLGRGDLALYRLIAQGNLVNVTSTLYLVPGVTALMDWALLGHAMAPLGMVGFGAVIAGLAMSFA